jgi:hypothetical protein
LGEYSANNYGSDTATGVIKIAILMLIRVLITIAGNIIYALSPMLGL